MTGARIMSHTGAKSFAGSYGSFEYSAVLNTIDPCSTLMIV